MMDDKKKMVPRIRFRGFEGETWEQRKLNKVLKVHSGRDYKKNNKGIIPVYGSGGYIASIDSALSETDAIGLGRKGTINRPQFLKGPFWTVDTLFYLTPQRTIDLLFLFTLISRINWLRYDESTGVPSLSKTTIGGVTVSVPVYEEQINIGEFSNTLDNLIVANEKRVNQLKKMKKLLMQKIFSQRWRFRGFNDPWEQRKGEGIS